MCITFEFVSTIVYEHQPISKCVPIDESVYHPRGATALTDAIGLAIMNMKNYIIQNNCKPGMVSFFITTDGEENSSTQFTNE